jgi:dUTP pyrophosphatase
MEDENNHTMSYWLLPRSSISKTSLRMSNSIGLIDEQFLGQIGAYVDNISNEDVFIEKGTRLFQIVSPTLTPLVIKLTDSFKETERGTKGFGSSGK